MSHVLLDSKTKKIVVTRHSPFDFSPMGKGQQSTKSKIQKRARLANQICTSEGGEDNSNNIQRPPQRQIHTHFPGLSRQNSLMVQSCRSKNTWSQGLLDPGGKGKKRMEENHGDGWWEKKKEDGKGKVGGNGRSKRKKQEKQKLKKEKEARNKDHRPWP